MAPILYAPGGCVTARAGSRIPALSAPWRARRRGFGSPRHCQRARPACSHRTAHPARPRSVPVASPGWRSAPQRGCPMPQFQRIAAVCLLALCGAPTRGRRRRERAGRRRRFGGTAAWGILAGAQSASRGKLLGRIAPGRMDGSMGANRSGTQTMTGRARPSPPGPPWRRECGNPTPRPRRDATAGRV